MIEIQVRVSCYFCKTSELHWVEIDLLPCEGIGLLFQADRKADIGNCIIWSPSDEEDVKHTICLDCGKKNYLA